MNDEIMANKNYHNNNILIRYVVHINDPIIILFLNK